MLCAFGPRDVIRKDHGPGSGELLVSGWAEKVNGVLQTINTYKDQAGSLRGGSCPDCMGLKTTNGDFDRLDRTTLRTVLDNTSTLASTTSSAPPRHGAGHDRGHVLASEAASRRPSRRI